ncbi:MAG: hypothetical protein HKN42_11870 [Granulosicoccus sp.]|nr:hypothetical protein [Granulosicoccus sp.]
MPDNSDVGDDPPTDIAEPEFSVVNFNDDSFNVDNPYFPLPPGTTSRLEGQNEEGDVETVVTTVSHETRTVNGVESAIVVDREYENGELVEETFDWYAQDIAGNVWYMGESSTEYEDGEAASMEGSWEAGADVDNTGVIASAGIIMKENPTVGDTYRHEIYPGIAEDGAEVTALDAQFTYADGSTVTALQVREFNPLEPESDDEYKYYKSGFGLIAEENVDGSARIELIESYDQREPDIDPANFSQPTLINHQYLPLVPGDTYTYQVETDEGVERIVVEVLDDTRLVAGINARVVRDRVYLDDVLIEDTFDWFAQDDEGNIWYLGEEVDNYEYDDNGELVGIDNEGAWEAGVDDAQPGIVMPAMPRVGDSYRQEYLPGEAEDIGAIVGFDVTVELRDGATYQTLKTRDWNPLDTESGVEFKYYAADVGLVREEDEEGEEQVDLVMRTQR